MYGINSQASSHGDDMSNDRNPLDSETIIDLPRGGSDLLTANFGPRLNTGETLTSVTSVSQSSQPTAGSGETTTLTVASGAINTGGAVIVDGQSRPASTVCQYRVTVPSTATVGAYKIKITCATSASNTKALNALIRVW